MSAYVPIRLWQICHSERGMGKEICITFYIKINFVYYSPFLQITAWLSKLTQPILHEQVKYAL